MLLNQKVSYVWNFIVKTDYLLSLCGVPENSLSIDHSKVVCLEGRHGWKWANKAVRQILCL